MAQVKKRIFVRRPCYDTRQNYTSLALYFQPLFRCLICEKIPLLVFFYMTSRPGWQSKTLTQQSLEIIGPSFYCGRKISKVSEYTDFKPNHVPPGSTLNQTKRGN